MKKMMFVFSCVLALVSAQSQGAEPKYCDPREFGKMEVRYTGSSPERLHVYKIGKVTVAGMAIGDSRAEDVAKLATSYSKAGAGDKYCTWYLNDKNKQAERSFVWRDLPFPGSFFGGTDGIADEYMQILRDQFDESNPSFVSCAQKYSYIGLGCNGMQHRGPSVFAMMLAYSGCSAENAVTIANSIWGSNGVSSDLRIEMARMAAQLGAEHPAASRTLRELFQ